MIEYVKKDDILLSLCEYCDSHVVGCGECPLKMTINEIKPEDVIPVKWIKEEIGRLIALRQDYGIYAARFIDAMLKSWRNQNGKAET